MTTLLSANALVTYDLNLAELRPSFVTHLEYSYEGDA